MSREQSSKRVKIIACDVLARECHAVEICDGDSLDTFLCRTLSAPRG